MKRLLQASMILMLYTWVVSAKRRRVRFGNCSSAKTTSELMAIKAAQSRVECSVICLNDPLCLSASYCKTTDGYMCQLSRFYADGSCSGFVADDGCSQTAMVNPCENGGTLHLQNRTCHCVEGFVGDYCQRRYRDCMETPGDNIFYLIQPMGSDYIFEWKCNAGEYSVTEFQFTETYNYTYTWHVMKLGLPTAFGTYYFIGLESLHQLTKQGRYDMYVSLFISGEDFGLVWYRNIRVDSEAEGYALHWDYFQRGDDPNFNSDIFQDGFGGAGDATKTLNGARFGTHDNDINDCANVRKIGWWYNPLGCMAMNIAPNGMNWPVNRNGTIVNEYTHFTKMGLKVVHFYERDDLVL